jgi:glycosyltransferase involved in cell wall biosynthesis
LLPNWLNKDVLKEKSVKRRAGRAMEKMKILIIAYYYPPINTGGTMRPLKMGKYLSRWGHDVSILTNTYEKDCIEEGNPRILRMKDISFNKNRSGIRKRLQWLGLRLFTEILNTFGIYHSIYTWWKRHVMENAAVIMGQVEPDIIVATYPPVETLEIGHHLSQKYNVPMVVDFRDGLIFEPIEAKRIGRFKCIRDRYAEIEKTVVSHATAITSVSEPITVYYQETYSPPIAEVISNSFDPEDFDELENFSISTRFDPSDFNIVFTGRFVLSSNETRVGYFFDALRLLIKKNAALEGTLKIHLVGEYRKNELEEFQDLIDRGIVINHGFVERRVSLAFQLAARLLLVITSPNIRSMATFKIFEYLYAKKPILALTHRTVLEDIIIATKSGWLVHPHQVEAIVSILERIITEPEFYNSVKPDWEEIERYSTSRQIEKLEHLLRDAIDRGRAKKEISR